MKKLLLFSFFLFMSPALFAQSPSQPQQYIFSDIVSGRSPGLFNSKVSIKVDFGQRTKYFEDNRMRDPRTGELIIFNSIVDALNFMSAEGWELVQVYVEVGENTSRTHYLMKKPIEEADAEEANGLY